ncbi:hypothetical protein CPB84DRAFT_1742827 [Gymnopilus junonius]|uniref:Uncharacterized protein n=1 Tax=Gymnopilus junonius TaxID=109634 RepID=A0A9P5P2W5_GYMJU|nr:hypothetical protein CPB84DRAFT_1742827 [Gymnopilus junonius]
MNLPHPNSTKIPVTSSDCPGILKDTPILIIYPGTSRHQPFGTYPTFKLCCRFLNTNNSVQTLHFLPSESYYPTTKTQSLQGIGLNSSERLPMPQILAYGIMLLKFLFAIRSPFSVTTSNGGITITKVPTPRDWSRLNETVGGSLSPGVPWTKPCFSVFNGESEASDMKQCTFVQKNYFDHLLEALIQQATEILRITHSFEFLKENYESYLAPAPVKSKEDVIASLNFVKEVNVPLVIKNTGMHKLKYVNALADSPISKHILICKLDSWRYWRLSPGRRLFNTCVYGMGVDRVLQYEAITPVGAFRVTHAYQHQDLFWALRSGGGGTFAIVLEETIMASPSQTYRLMICINWPVDNKSMKLMLATFHENVTMLATQQSWGGFFSPPLGNLILSNPKLSIQHARETVQPLIDLSTKLGGISNVTEFPSFFECFKAYSVGLSETDGNGTRKSGRVMREEPKPSTSLEILRQVQAHTLMKPTFMNLIMKVSDCWIVGSVRIELAYVTAFSEKVHEP